MAETRISSELSNYEILNQRSPKQGKIGFLLAVVGL